MVRTVIGVFREREDAEDAINELDRNGYNPYDMSIVMRNGDAKIEDAGTNVASGAVSGIATGGVLGGLAGLLIGTGVFPGLGTLLIGGPLAVALGLSGAAATTVSGVATGAVAGGLIGGLMGLGLKRDEAEVYEDQIREGAILLAVPVRSEEAPFVQDLMEDYGAINIKTLSSSVDELREEDYEGRYYSREDLYAPVGMKGGRRRMEEDLENERRQRRKSRRGRRSRF